MRKKVTDRLSDVAYIANRTYLLMMGDSEFGQN